MRAGIHADALDPKLGAGDDQGRDGEEGGGRGVAGDGEALGPELGLAAQQDRLALAGDVGAEQLQQALAMVAGRDRLDDPGEAGDVERGEQQRRS